MEVAKPQLNVRFRRLLCVFIIDFKIKKSCRMRINHTNGVFLNNAYTLFEEEK